MIKYLFAFVTVFVLFTTSLISIFLPTGVRSSLVSQASTNISNLEHGRVDTLVTSAFVTDSSPWRLLVFVVPVAVIALFSLVSRFGNLRALGLVAAAQVVGTLGSEGVLWLEIGQGMRPASFRLIADVGPSYVIVSALTAVVIYGTGQRGRLACVFALGIWGRSIIDGMTGLDFTAVGHVISIVTAIATGYWYVGHGRRPEQGDATAERDRSRWNMAGLGVVARGGGNRDADHG